jgi:uncharacterized protein (DUF2249 family)
LRLIKVFERAAGYIHPMNTLKPLELDVRALVARQRPPMPAIQQAISQLEAGQALRLIAPFEPVPLYEFMQARGFLYTASETEPGVWTVVFSREADAG